MGSAAIKVGCIPQLKSASIGDGPLRVPFVLVWIAALTIETFHFVTLNVVARRQRHLY
jgi:hypothetical protein